MICTLYGLIVGAILALLVVSLIQTCPTDKAMQTDRCLCLAAQLVLVGLSYCDYSANQKFNLKCIWSCLFVIASVAMTILSVLDGLAVHLADKNGKCADVKVDPTVLPMGEAVLCIAWGLLFVVVQTCHADHGDPEVPTPEPEAASPAPL
jgi:hypothetical protein